MGEGKGTEGEEGRGNVASWLLGDGRPWRDACAEGMAEFFVTDPVTNSSVHLSPTDVNAAGVRTPQILGVRTFNI